MWSEDEEPQTQQQLEGEGHTNDPTLSLSDRIASKNTRREAYERLLAKRKLESESAGKHFTKNEGSSMQPITISAESEGEDEIADAPYSVSKEEDTPVKRKVKRRISSVLSSKLAWGVALRKQPRELKTAKNDPLPNHNMVSKKKFSKRSKAHASMKRDDKDLQFENQGNFTNSEELKKCSHGQELPNDFKMKLSKEIEKQIFEGLDEISKAALQNIQVVEIEGIYPSKSNRNDENVSPKQYEAKVKLMAVLHIPVTIQPLTDINKPETKEEGNDDENLLEVPNMMFYDFDKDRCEESFAAGQVWALYDRVNSMPTRYVQINKVISTSPFNVEVQRLEPDCSSVEACEWVKAGNPLACGAYRKSKDLQYIGHVDVFSHVMKWEERHGVIDVYPLVGDIWAMFKDWKELDGSKRIKSGYKIVRVVAVNEEETILSVVPLENDENYPTLFLEQRMQRPLKICKHETTRFSHRILSYSVTDSELHESLESVLELDPASIPPNLCKD